MITRCFPPFGNAERNGGLTSGSESGFTFKRSQTAALDSADKKRNQTLDPIHYCHGNKWCCFKAVSESIDFITMFHIQKIAVVTIFALATSRNFDTSQ